MTAKRLLVDAAARQRIAEDLDTSLMCLAGAGAGKTHALVQRMVACVRTGTADIRHMAAITFTRKAAGELRGRFFAALQEEAIRVAEETEGPEAARQQHRLRDAVSRLDQCSIGTIHAFCARLLRERPIEAGLPPNFTEVEEREEMILARVAWDGFLQARSVAGDDRLLAIEDTGLTAEQFYQFYLDRCQHSDLLLKPTTVPRPDLTPALTQVCELVRDVAAQIPEPLPEGQPDRLMETVRELRHFVDFAGPPSDADRERLLRDLASTTKTAITLKRWGSPGSPGQQLARALKNEVLPALRDQLLKPLLAQWRNYVYTLAGALVDEAMIHYRDTRLAASTLTFNDLLEMTAALLRQRADVCAHFRRRYQRLFVDEFQDTDPLQAEVLLYLTGVEHNIDDWRELTPRPGSLFLVGDEKQSIYRFRRADLDIFRLVRDRVVAGGGAVVELTTSFRSRPAVAAFTNGAFEPLFDSYDRRYQAAFQRLVPHRPSQDGAGVYQLRARADSGGRRETQTRDEAARIAAFIAAALRGRTPLNGEHAVLGRRAQPGDFMLLTRSRHYLGEYARALEAEQVAYDITGAGSMRNSIELRALVDALDTLLEADNPVPLVAYLRGPFVGMGDDELYVLRQLHWRFCWPAPAPAADIAAVARLQRAQRTLQNLWDDVRRRPLAASLERLIESTGLAGFAATGAAGSSRAGNLLRILALVRDAQSRRHLGWAQVTHELRDLLEDDRQRVEEMTLETGRDDVVRVMNLHQAKGLEAKVVFLVDAFDTSSRKHTVDVHVSRVAERPYLSMAVTRRARFGTTVLAEPEGWEADAAEETRYLEAESLRLVYVAATRARDVLVLGTTAQSRGAWSLLEPAIAGAPDLPSPAPAAPQPSQASNDEGIDIAAVQARTRAQRDLASKPSYVLHAVTEDEEHPAHEADPETRGRGRSFGTVVHRLFESAVLGHLPVDDAAELQYAQRLLAEEGLDGAETASAAQQALAAFRSSAIWHELRQAAAEVYVEVPFASMAGDTIHRGVIDLVYRVPGGWKIVDYKTHRAPTPERMALFAQQVGAYAAHWEAVSGQSVVERGIWLVSSEATDRYIALP
ncbi:MAG: UvrD-helicase domain-containing protein [bacterium]|nr:UvrD-helicase domain-containing protein [bacterium]